MLGPPFFETQFIPLELVVAISHDCPLPHAGCTCPPPPSTTGRKHNGGGRNPCGNNYNGTQLTGCPDSNQYVQCVNTTCTAKTCGTNQLWNQTGKSCYSCPTGQHVSADNTSCVCDQVCVGTDVHVAKPMRILRIG